MKKHEIKLPSFERLQDKEDLNACRPALDWLASQKDQKTAFYNCTRGDWLIWVLAATGQMNPTLDLQIQMMALETPLGDGRKVIDLITDKRSKAFIDMKERRLNGEYISDDEWRKAKRDAADVAAADAADYTDAADDAVAAAAYDAYAAYDANAYAVYVAYAAAVYAAAATAAVDASLFQANELRKMIIIVD